MKRAFGAKGDRFTDDTQVIQLAELPTLAGGLNAYGF